MHTKVVDNESEEVLSRFIAGLGDQQSLGSTLLGFWGGFKPFIGDFFGLNYTLVFVTIMPRH